MACSLCASRLAAAARRVDLDSSLPTFEALIASALKTLYQISQNNTESEDIELLPGIMKAIIAHPECPPDVIKASDFAGSTSGMINYVRDNQPKKVMMVTECSMSDNIQVENPNVEFIRPCNMCPHMKKITLPKILDCLENETGEIIMDQQTINKARLSVEKMVAIGR